MVARRYIAFISYSHKDSDFTAWLHRELEGQVIPRRLRKNLPGSGWRPLRPIFRDQEELPISSSLSDNIHEALSASETLIVVCSPQAAASRWVSEEIRIFKALGKGSRILAVVIAGEPNGSDKPGAEELECFPPTLRFELDPAGGLTSNRTEPLAADLRCWPGGGTRVSRWAQWIRTREPRRRAVAKLVAALLEVPFDDVWRREVVRQRRIAVAVAALCLSLALMAAAVARFQRAAERELLTQFELRQRDALAAASQASVLRGSYLEAALLQLAFLDLSPGYENEPADRTARALAMAERSPRVRSYLREEEEALLLPNRSRNVVLLGTEKGTVALDFMDISRSKRLRPLRNDDSRIVGWNGVARRVAFSRKHGGASLLNWQTGVLSPLPESEQVTSVFPCDDGNRTVWQVLDGTIGFVSSEGGTESFELSGVDGAVLQAVSRDGSRLALTTHTDGQKLVVVGPGSAGREPHPAIDWGEEEPLFVTRSEFAGDGRALICRTVDGHLFVFSSADCRLLHGPLKDVFDEYVVSDDGNAVYLTRDNRIEVWRLDAPANATRPICSFPAPVATLAPDPSGRLLAAGFDKTCFFLDPVSGGQSFPPVTIGSRIGLLSWTDQGGIVMWSDDHELWSFDPPGFSNFIAIDSDTAVAEIAAVGPDTLVLRGTDSSSLLRRNRAGWTRLQGPGKVLAISPDGGALLARPDGSTTATLYRVGPGSFTASAVSLPVPTTPLARLALSPGGNAFIATDGGSRTRQTFAAFQNQKGLPATNVLFVAPDTGAEIATFPVPMALIDQVVPSPEGKRVAICGGMRLMVFEVAAGAPVLLDAQLESFARAVAFDRSGRRIAASWTGAIGLWDATAVPYRQLRSIPSKIEARSLAFSGECELLAALAFDAQSAEVWSLDSAARVPLRLTLPSASGGAESIIGMCLDDERAWLWLAGVDGTLAAYSTRNGEPTFPALKLREKPTCMARAGNSIIIGTSKGALEIRADTLTVSQAETLRKELELETSSTWDSGSLALRGLTVQERGQRAQELGVALDVGAFPMVKEH